MISENRAITVSVSVTYRVLNNHKRNTRSDEYMENCRLHVQAAVYQAIPAGIAAWWSK
jgi:hypothetical protein